MNEELLTDEQVQAIPDKAKDTQDQIMRMQQDCEILQIANERLVWELEKIKLERDVEKRRDILQVIWDYYHGDKLKGGK